MNHNIFSTKKIEFILHIEADEAIGKYLREYNKQYDSTLHRDKVYDSGRKDWRL